MPDDPKVSAAQAKASAAERAANAQATTATEAVPPGSVAPAPDRAFNVPPASHAAAHAPQQVVVQGMPLAAAAPPQPEYQYPYTGPSEIVEGGRYLRKATLKGGQHYGGEVVDAHGNVLATFEPGQINTGRPEDGTKPEPPQP